MIINSILDTDLYKFSMQQAVCQLYPRAHAHYAFINRGGTKFPRGFDKRLNQAIDRLQDVGLTGDERRYLMNQCGDYLTPVYIDFLSGYRFNPREVTVSLHKGELAVEVSGPWYRTILWEVPLMAMISELYFQMVPHKKTKTLSETASIAKEKGERLKRAGVRFADFGTRRRFAFLVQEVVVKELSQFEEFVGTSNVYLAKKCNLKPMGTQAHEWFMFHGAVFGYTLANSIAMQKWIDVYGGHLGIALPDTFTSDVFLNSFDSKFSRLFDGVRHDSGDPIRFARSFIDHYKSQGIDPMTKTIVFSDGLDIGAVLKIHEYCKGKILDSYGIGTHLTNDVGAKPLNMVIKMTACTINPNWKHGHAWKPTVKLSDVVGKHTGDKEELELCMKTLGIELRKGI